jgi:tetratricopeptide (TPR) repeat protein
MEHHTAVALLERGRVALGEEKIKYARQLFRNALKACGRNGSPQLRAEIHVAIGKVERDLGQDEPATSHYRSAADLYRGLDDSMGLAHAVRHVADILRKMDRTQEAESYILEAIRIYRAQQPLPQLHLANALRVAALLREQAGEQNGALPLWLEARDLYRAVGVEAGVAESRAHAAKASAV